MKGVCVCGGTCEGLLRHESPKKNYSVSGRVKLGCTSGPVCHMNTPPRSGGEIARTVSEMNRMLLEKGGSLTTEKKDKLATATEYNTDNNGESKGEILDVLTSIA